MTRDEFLAKLEASPSPLRNCSDNSVAYAYQIGALWAFDLLSSEIAEKDARIAEFEAAIRNLQTVKGRFHSEQATKALFALLAKETT